MTHHPDQPQVNSGGGLFSSYRPEGWQRLLDALSSGTPYEEAIEASGVDDVKVDQLARRQRGRPARVPQMAEELNKALEAGDAVRKAARRQAIQEAYPRPSWFDPVLRRIETGVPAYEALKEAGKKPTDVYLYTSPPKVDQPPRNPQMREDWDRARRDGQWYYVRSRLDAIKDLMSRGHDLSSAVRRAGIEQKDFAAFLAAYPDVRKDLDELAASLPTPRPYRTGIFYLTDMLRVSEAEAEKAAKEEDGSDDWLIDVRIFLRIVEALDVTPIDTTVPALRDRILKLIGQRYDFREDLPPFLKEGS